MGRFDGIPHELPNRHIVTWRFEKNSVFLIKFNLSRFF
jgi:hypothetical protein